MDCAAFEKALLAGGGGPDAEEHLRGCEACRALAAGGAELAGALRGLAGPGDAPTGSAELEKATRDLLARERGPIAAARAWPRWLRLGLLAALVAAEAAFILGVTPRADLSAYPPARLGVILAAGGLLVLVAGWQALRPLYLPPAPRWLWRSLLAVALVGPFLLAVLPELATDPSHAPGYSTGRYAFYCLANGSLLGAIVLLAARALDRGGHRGADHALLAAAGAGLCGVVGLLLECPVNLPLHLVTSHVWIPIVLVACYLLVRRA